MDDSRAVHEELADLLRRHPTAQLFAIDERARLLDLPASLPVADGHVEAETLNGVDLVVPADRGLGVDAFLRATSGGSASAVVRMADGHQAELTFFDVRPVHGAIVGVIVHTGEAGSVEPIEIVDLPVRSARCERDAAGVVIAMDDDVQRMLGFTADELVGAEPLARIHPDDVERDIANWVDTLTAPGQPRRWRGRHLRADGSWVWIEFTNVNHLEDPDHPHVLSDMLDISDEMALIEALREREELMRRLTESLPLGVLQIGGDRSIIHQNDRLDDVVGRPGARTLDDKLAGVVPEDQPALHASVAAAADHGQDGEIEVRLALTPGADLRMVRIALTALMGEGHRPAGAILTMWDVTESRRMHRELERRATTDPLTGVLNRRSVMQRLDAELSRPSADGMGTAVVFVDLDGFKAVNDCHGHATGDELLMLVADRLRATVRGQDVVGRLGGDEFLVVFPAVDQPEQALDLGRRLAVRVGEPAVVAGEPLTPRASYGVAWTANGTRTPEALVALADAAMYECKSQGRGTPLLHAATD